MKVAGSKNPGAWYRMNKFLKSLNKGGQASNPLIAAVKALDTYQPFIDAINDLATKANLPNNAVTDLATEYVTVGIPLEVWMGRLSFDTYTPSKDADGDTVYTPDHADAVLKFASDLRRTLTVFKVALRTINDIRNVPGERPNPGGVADATKGT